MPDEEQRQLEMERRAIERRALELARRELELEQRLAMQQMDDENEQPAQRRNSRLITPDQLADIRFGTPDFGRELMEPEEAGSI